MLPQDELQFLRVRSAKQEIMVSARKPLLFRLTAVAHMPLCQDLGGCHLHVQLHVHHPGESCEVLCF